MKSSMKHLVLFLLIFCMSWVSVLAQKDMEARKLQLALYAINNLYVDSTNQAKLVEDAITGMLEKLDPHSTYTNPEETKEMTEPLAGNFDGIGIQFNMLTDTVYVIQVISGGPSEKVGLIAGGKMSTPEGMKRRRGPKGSEVHIKVKRGGEPKLLDFTITRGKIPVYSIDAAYMADKKTGYIKLNRFAASSTKEFKEALNNLTRKGMTQLILDLQGNGGGYLNVAIELADEFLSRGKLIVYTEGEKQKRQEALSTYAGSFEDGRLVILVDEASASASEILSGAIQDWDRGIIIGRRTFGKGLVQRPIPLPDGSMIRLTVARYYTPTGRCIQKPYEKGKGEEYAHDLMSRYKHGELMSADSIHFPDSLKFQTLEKARTVYGGGGIMPDVFVPIDTTYNSEYHRSLISNGLVNRVAMNYLDQHREELNKRYKKVHTYKERFVVPESVMNDLRIMADNKKIAFKEEEYNRSLPLIRLQIKALIARDLFDTTSYFYIINDVNQTYQEALRLINDEIKYDEILDKPNKTNE